MHYVAGSKTSDMLAFVDSRIMTELQSVTKFVSYYSSSWTDSPCQLNRTEYDEIEMFFEVELFVADSVWRIYLEQELNNFLTQSIPGDQLLYSIELSNNVNTQIRNSSQSGCKIENGFSSNSSELKYAPQMYRKVLVSSVLLCRLITLGTEEYNVTENNHVSLARKDAILPTSQYEILTDGSMRVCYEYLKQIAFFKNHFDAYPNFEIERYLWIVTLSCTIVSVIVLFISLLIYCIFPELRTIPGKLFMMLMISLLLVLIFQQVSSAFVGFDVGCSVIGVFLHYAWLVVFTSMQASNFRMFKVFTATNTRMQSSIVGCNKEIILNIFYILFLPFFIVASHIAISAILSEGKSFGYGGRKCFIMDKTSIFVTFISPIVLICLSNIYFFVRTVASIHNTPIPQGQESQRNELGIYMRLTSITGLSWLLQVIDSFIPLTEFSFVASSINSLQGLTIFMAFILNKRTMNMLRRKFGFKSRIREQL